MPRQSRSRPAARPSAPAASSQQSRGAHTQAAPPVAAKAPQTAPVPHQAQQQGPGMMAQMAANVGSVAAGSVIGHGISNMIFGGGSSHAAAAVPEAPVQQQSYEQRAMGGMCEIQAKDFTQCLSATGNDMGACGFYLEALKSCQQAAAPY